MRGVLAWAGLLLAQSLYAGGTEKVLKLTPAGDIQRVEFRCLSFSNRPPSAVLVLCPGQNGDGAEFLTGEEWKTFAKTNNLALLIPGFVSGDEELKAGRGYFVASRGSGKMLLEALELAGWSDVPLLLYGFSGGAHFTVSFSAWSPGNVLGFCAYSFGWWSPPPANLQCPAIIACGQFDAARYGSSFAYFQAGRRQGSPWAWASIEGQEHDPCPRLENFVREYFRSLLDPQVGAQVTVDNVRKTLLKGSACDPLTTSVLPCEAVLASWQSLHHP